MYMLLLIGLRNTPSVLPPWTAAEDCPRICLLQPCLHYLLLYKSCCCWKFLLFLMKYSNYLNFTAHTNTELGSVGNSFFSNTNLHAFSHYRREHSVHRCSFLLNIVCFSKKTTILFLYTHQTGTSQGCSRGWMGWSRYSWKEHQHLFLP